MMRTIFLIIITTKAFSFEVLHGVKDEVARFQRGTIMVAQFMLQGMEADSSNAMYGRYGVRTLA